MSRNILYEENHLVIDGKLMKKCNHHHEYFPEENPWFSCTEEFFYKTDKNKTDGLHPECKRCSVKNTQKNYDPGRHTELTNFYYHNDPEYKKRKKSYNYTDEEKERQSQWRKDNPEKCSEYAEQHRIHDISKIEWDGCLREFDYSCAYCGISEEESLKIQKQRLHKDHADENGANDLRNAIPACRSCNSKKHQDDMETWFREQEFFIEERLQFIKWWLTEGYKKYIEEKPPYRIIRKQNEDKRTYHHELWTVDEKRNLVEIIAERDKRKDIINDINNGIIIIPIK